MLACDTPEMASRGDLALGGGPGDVAVLVPRPRHPQRGHPASRRSSRLVEDGRGGRGHAAPALGPRGRADGPELHPVHGSARASPASTWACPCATRTRRLEVVDPADIEALVTLLDAALDRITPGPGRSSAPREPHARRRHRDVRVQGRPRRRRGRGRRDRDAAPPDARAAAGLGRASAPTRTGGPTSSRSPASCWPVSGLDARAIDAVATSAIGPCMLPVDARRRARS